MNLEDLTAQARIILAHLQAKEVVKANEASSKAMLSMLQGDWLGRKALVDELISAIVVWQNLQRLAIVAMQQCNDDGCADVQQSVLRYFESVLEKLRQQKKSLSRG